MGLHPCTLSNWLGCMFSSTHFFWWEYLPPPVSIPPPGGGTVTGWFQKKNATVSYCTGLHNCESSLLELCVPPLC